MLYVRDENSRNGTLVNGKRIASGQPTLLRAGDQLGFGNVALTLATAQEPAVNVPPIYPPPRVAHASRRDNTLVYLLVGGGITLLFLVFLVVLGVLQRGAPIQPQATQPGAVVASPKLLAPQQYAVASDSLAQAIADLNRAELKFIRDAKSAARIPEQRLPGMAMPASFAPDLLDDDLREIAARAMNVAQIAEKLGLTAITQDGGSETARKIANQYLSIARLAYALVIEAQNLRDGLTARTASRTDAINTIAEYGARLWNPSVTEPTVTGNPFLPNVKDATTIAVAQFLDAAAATQFQAQLGAGKSVSAWVATSPGTVSKTIALPAPRVPVADPFDPNLLIALTTADGQSDGDRARQVAAKSIATLAGSAGMPPAGSSATQVVVVIPQGATVAGAQQVANGVLATFPNGTTSATTQTTTGDDVTLTSINTGGNQVALSQVPMRPPASAAPPLSLPTVPSAVPSAAPPTAPPATPPALLPTVPPTAPAELLRAFAFAEIDATNPMHGYNSRTFVLATPATVGLSGGSAMATAWGSNLWIRDIAGTTFYNVSRGALSPGSTLALPAGAYCLHVDYVVVGPAPESDNRKLTFPRPPAPAPGEKMSVTAFYDPNPVAPASRYTPAAFTLSAPQVITLSSVESPPPAATSYWIADTRGMWWYWVSNGVTQDGSAELGLQNDREGVILPAGTYLLVAERGHDLAVRYGITASFVGMPAAVFTQPQSHNPCGSAVITWLPVTPTPTPTNTPTPTPTNTPTPTVTSTVPPPVCPGPPVISSFTANPSTINAGESTTLSWGLVTNATAAYLEGIGVATPGSATDKPTSTKTYTLRAVGCGGTTSKQVTVTVNQAPPPPAPSKFVCGLTAYDSTSKGYVKRFTLSRSSPGVSLSGNSTDGQKVTGDCFINQYGAFECDVLVGTCKYDYSTSNIGQYPTENEGYTVSTSPGCVAPYEPWRIEMKWCNR